MWVSNNCFEPNPQYYCCRFRFNLRLLLYCNLLVYCAPLKDQLEFSCTYSFSSSLIRASINFDGCDGFREMIGFSFCDCGFILYQVFWTFTLLPVETAISILFLTYPCHTSQSDNAL